MWQMFLRKRQGINDVAGFKKTYFAMGNAGGAYAACGWPILSFTAQRCSVCWGSALRHLRGREVLGLQP